MSNCNIIMFIVVSILLSHVNGEDICGPVVDILCVKDVLTKIAKSANDIHKMANAIEHKIWEREQTKTTLNNSINHRTLKLNATFPTSEYPNLLLHMNNIDKFIFIRVIKQQHDAVSYLYKSVESLHNIKNTFGAGVDDLLNRISNILHIHMMCNYRNILHVYAENSLPLPQIVGIRLSRTRKREMTSAEFNSYSIVIARLLREWMITIDRFVGDLENILI